MTKFPKFENCQWCGKRFVNNFMAVLAAKAAVLLVDKSAIDRNSQAVASAGTTFKSQAKIWLVKNKGTLLYT